MEESLPKLPIRLALLLGNQVTLRELDFTTLLGIDTNVLRTSVNGCRADPNSCALVCCLPRWPLLAQARTAGDAVEQNLLAGTEVCLPCGDAAIDEDVHGYYPHAKASSVELALVLSISIDQSKGDQWKGQDQGSLAFKHSELAGTTKRASHAILPALSRQPIKHGECGEFDD